MFGFGIAVGFFLNWVKGKLLKPINFDVEIVLGVVLRTCMRCHKHKLIYIVPVEDKNT